MPWPAPATRIVPVPIPPRPQFPLPQSLRPPSPKNIAPARARGAHPDDVSKLVSKAKARAAHPVGPPVVLLPDPLPEGDFPTSDEPASSSSGPVAVPGLPVTDGEFPIQQTPLPEPTQELPVPDADGDSDSDATVDYREDSLLALASGDEDVLIRLPGNFKVDPSLVPLDGDGFASWLTKQDKVRAGTVTAAMQQKYAKEIRAAKLEEFRSYWTMTLSVLLTDASLVAMLIFLPVAGFSL